MGLESVAGVFLTFAAIVQSAVAYWNEAGYEPFIFPAMGSHGAATAEGQAAVLARYGIHEGAMGCPVISSLEVVSLGRTPEGIEVFIDRNAHGSDGVMLIGRIKWHTDFEGKLESGLCKMMTLGLGKLAGAGQYHAFAHTLGLEYVIRMVGRHVPRPARSSVAWQCWRMRSTTQPRSKRFQPAQLKHAKKNCLLSQNAGRRIPVDHLDFLMIDEIGKEISGAGMDTKVVNRSSQGGYNTWRDAGTRIERIFVRDLSDLTDGNAIGIGLADVAHDRVLAKIDWHKTWINCITSGSTPCGRMPIHFATDRQCIENIAPTTGKVDSSLMTIAWIQNTLKLTRMMLSDNLLEEIKANPDLELLGPAQDFCS